MANEHARAERFCAAGIRKDGRIGSRACYRPLWLIGQSTLGASNAGTCYNQ